MRGQAGLFCLALFTSGDAVVLAQHGTLVGRIVDEDGALIVNADVTLLEVDRAILHSTSGRFTFDSVPAGRHTVMARAIGFRPAFTGVQVPAGDTAFVLFRMRPIVQRLATLDTTVSLTTAVLPDYARRSGSGMGYFIDQAAFEAARPLSISQFLRRFSVLQIVDSAGVPQAISRRGPKVVATGAAMTSVPCVMRTAVDGQMLPWGTSIDLVHANAVAAIEIFTGPATVPTEFGGQAKDIGCGLVAIWTRRQ